MLDLLCLESQQKFTYKDYLIKRHLDYNTCIEWHRFSEPKPYGPTQPNPSQSQVREPAKIRITSHLQTQSTYFIEIKCLGIITMAYHDNIARKRTDDEAFGGTGRARRPPLLHT